METRLLIGGEQVAGDGGRSTSRTPPPRRRSRAWARRRPSSSTRRSRPPREAVPGWAAMPAVERAELLHEVAARLRARTDDLARVMTLEGGKPLVENSDEVGWTAAAFDYYAEMGRNFAGRVIPLDRVDPARAGREGADRRRGLHRAVELPAAPVRLEARAGARRRQHGGRQAVGAHAAVHAHARRLLRRTCRPASSTWSRARATSARRSSTTSASTASRSPARSRPARRSRRPAPSASRA